jgi:hypothetical protein
MDSPEGFRVSFPGPFSAHDVVFEGWRVPFLHAHPDDSCVMLVIDGRLAETFTVAEAEKVVPFLADAIAVALGYTCAPRGGDEEPPHKPQPRFVRTHGIVGFETEEAESNG